MTVIVTSGIEIRPPSKGIHLFAKPRKNPKKAYKNRLFTQSAPVTNTRENRAKAVVRRAPPLRLALQDVFSLECNLKTGESALVLGV